MQSNNDEKKYRFFDPFTGEAPLNMGGIKIVSFSYKNSKIIKRSKVPDLTRSDKKISI